MRALLSYSRLMLAPNSVGVLPSVSYQYLDGATSGAKRTHAVANFQKSESHMFLIGLRAGGFGLNLTAADYVIIADPWWNPTMEDQAASSAHRMGQERPVTITGCGQRLSRRTHHGRASSKRALAEGLVQRRGIQQRGVDG